MEDSDEDQRQTGSTSPVDDLSAAEDAPLSLNDTDDQPSSPVEKLQLEDLEDALPDIPAPQPTRSSARSAFLASSPASGGGGALDSDLLPMSRSNKGQSINLVLRHPLTNLRAPAGASGSLSSDYEAGKAHASETADEQQSESGNIYYARPALARSGSDNKQSLSGNNPFRKEAMQQQLAWVTEHDSDSQVVLRPKYATYVAHCSFFSHFVLHSS